MRHAWVALCVGAILTGAAAGRADDLPREEWGAMPVRVSHDHDAWTIAGKRNTVELDPRDLSIHVKAGPATWKMLASGPTDALVRAGGDEFPLRLADAGKLEVVPFDAGFKTGLKLELSGFRHAGATLDLSFCMTICLEGDDEDLVFDVVATESPTLAVRRLDWPPAVDGRDVDSTILSNHRGVLLPRDWPKPYYPIRSTNPDGTAKSADSSDVQSNVIESWSMSWWGFQRGKSAMMVIVETPDDAAYQFDHPAGGPTTIGPRWRATLGRLAYLRTCRMCFFPDGNYVDMAKRYRRHAIDTGLFVSLDEKIARKPIVKDLVGTPIVRMGILTDIVKDSLRYSATQPEKNHKLTTFDERASQLRQWKQQGLDRLCVVLTGWPNKGYDRQHPDELPPAPSAGGWDGMRRLADACRDIGYLFALHDQYRDLYVDAPSYDPQFAVHEEDDKSPAVAFPGTRFGQWKEGPIPFMNNWDGGKQAYLSNRFMPGHLKKNYAGLFDHGIRPQGIYLDVFGYCPPDEDFNPEHPTTRTDALNARRECYNWSRANIGFVGTEAACDWTIPYADFSSPLKSNKGVPIPLFNLVYHDAIITPYAPDDLRGYLNGGAPQMFSARDLSPDLLASVRRMAALHARVARAELLKHEFLDEKYRRERTTFSDGTTVTVDWDRKSVDIRPELNER